MRPTYDITDKNELPKNLQREGTGRKMLILFIYMGILLSAVGLLCMAGLCYVYERPSMYIRIPIEKMLKFVKCILIAYCADLLCLYILLLASILRLLASYLGKI